MKVSRRHFIADAAKLFVAGAIALNVPSLSSKSGHVDSLLKGNSIFEAVREARADSYFAIDCYRNAINYLKQGNEAQAKIEFNKGVESDMNLSTVDDILKPNYEKGMKQVKYDAVTGKDNFDELVYKSGKPTVVLFYARESGENSTDISKREAIVFKALSEMYGNKFNFVVYNDRIAPKKQGLTPNGKYWNISERSVNEKIKDLPSIAIYSKFDLEKGETPTKNDGKIKEVDLMKGAPSEGYIFPTFEATSLWWINQHCLYKTNPDGDGKVYKYNNTFKLTEVENVFVK